MSDSLEDIDERPFINRYVVVIERKINDRRALDGWKIAHEYAAYGTRREADKRIGEIGNMKGRSGKIQRFFVVDQDKEPDFKFMVDATIS